MFYSKADIIEIIGDALKAGSDDWEVYPYVGRLINRELATNKDVYRLEKKINVLLDYLHLQFIENQSFIQADVYGKV